MEVIEQITTDRSIDKFENVVLIDDDYATNFFHEIIVSESGLVNNYTFFSSTIDALIYFKNIRNNDPSTLPELVFLDINLPKMTGWEFLDEFKKLDINPKPVFVMLSTSLNPADDIKANNNPLVLELIDKPLTKEYLNKLKSRVSSM